MVMGAYKVLYSNHHSRDIVSRFDIFVFTKFGMDRNDFIKHGGLMNLILFLIDDVQRK